MDKATVLISFTSEESARHIDARRLDDSDIYACPDDVFDILDALYKNLNRVRDARRQFASLRKKTLM